MYWPGLLVLFQGSDKSNDNSSLRKYGSATFADGISLRTVALPRKIPYDKNLPERPVSLTGIDSLTL